MPKNLNLTSDQHKTINAMESEDNVLITGVGGVGKSHLIREYSKTHSKSINTAMTGLAAKTINGRTIHSLFHIKNLTNLNIDSAVFVLEPYDSLVIDEISMMTAAEFKKIYAIVKKIRERRKFTLIVCGDFLQLPPIYDNFNPDDNCRKMAFECKEWEEMDFTIAIMHQQVRQNNMAFVDALHKIRLGDSSGLEYIKNNSSKTPLSDAICVYTNKNDVREKNNSELEKLTSREWTYSAKGENFKDIPRQEINFEEKLVLKENARVMTIVNEANGAYINGSTGTICELNDEYISILFDGWSFPLKIERYDFEFEITIKDEEGIEEKKKIIITQFPVRLAYALTVHSMTCSRMKSTSMTNVINL